MILKPRELRAGQPPCVLRLRQPRPQARAAVLQRRASTAMRRSRWPTRATASSCAVATRWPGSRGKATCCRATAAWCSTCRWRAINGKPITGRIRVEYIADRAGHHLFSAQRQDRGALLCHCLARHARCVLTRRRYPYDTPAAIAARPVAFASAESGGRRRDTVPGTRQWCHPHRHIYLAGRLPARLDL